MVPVITSHQPTDFHDPLSWARWHGYDQQSVKKGSILWALLRGDLDLRVGVAEGWDSRSQVPGRLPHDLMKPVTYQEYTQRLARCPVDHKRSDGKPLRGNAGWMWHACGFDGRILAHSTATVAETVSATWRRVNTAKIALGRVEARVGEVWFTVNWPGAVVKLCIDESRCVCSFSGGRATPVSRAVFYVDASGVSLQLFHGWQPAMTPAMVPWGPNGPYYYIPNNEDDTLQSQLFTGCRHLFDVTGVPYQVRVNDAAQQSPSLYFPCMFSAPNSGQRRLMEKKLTKAKDAGRRVMYPSADNGGLRLRDVGRGGRAVPCGQRGGRQWWLLSHEVVEFVLDYVDLGTLSDAAAVRRNWACAACTVFRGRREVCRYVRCERRVQLLRIDVSEYALAIAKVAAQVPRSADETENEKYAPVTRMCNSLISMTTRLWQDLLHVEDDAIEGELRIEGQLVAVEDAAYAADARAAVERRGACP